MRVKTLKLLLRYLEQERTVVIEQQSYDPAKKLVEIREQIKKLLNGEISESTADEIIKLYDVEEIILGEIEVHAQNVRVLIQESNELLKEIDELKELMAKEIAKLQIPSRNMP